MHETFLQQALALAQMRRGFCSPNPAVGALVVKNGIVIAEGVHHSAGSPHAEPSALEQAGEHTQGATLYVSLEPCNHWGKTPPCTEKIIESGIKEVYFAYHDPNPVVANKTTLLLRQANITCEYVAIPAAREFYRSYAYWLKTGKPFVTAKIASSLDGKIAARDGSPIAITGESCKQFTCQGRMHTDIILTSNSTLCNDNPQLNVRLNQQAIAKPVAVLATDGELPNNLNIFNTSLRLLVFHDINTTIQNKYPNIQYIGVNRDNTGLNIHEVLAKLGAAGYHDVWLEAGGMCFSSFMQQRAVNRAYVYIGPKILGSDAKSVYHGNHLKFDETTQISWKIMDRDVMCQIDFSEDEQCDKIVIPT